MRKEKVAGNGLGCNSKFLSGFEFFSKETFMNFNEPPLFPHPIEWTLSFSGIFSEFRSLAVLLEKVGAVSHWAVVVESGEGLYVEEGIIKPMSSNSIRSLEWFNVSNYASLGVPLYVDSHIIHEALPLIHTLLSSKGSLPSFSPSIDGCTNITDDLPFLISSVDQNFNYVYVNKYYEIAFHKSREEIIGTTVEELVGQKQFETVKPLILKALAGEHVYEDITVQLTGHANDLHTRYATCSFTPKYVANEVVGVNICIRDQTPLKRITNGLKQFYEITTDMDSSLEEKTQAVLKLGCTILNLPVGIVSHVEGQNYQVMQGIGGPEPGMVFDLGECYCVHTLNRGEVTGFYHAGQSEIATHPCYQTFQLEAYLGVSLKVASSVWGTLNFSSPDARQQDFSEDEYELVKLFGQWLQSELAKDQEQKVAKAADVQQRLILESVHDGIVGVDQNCKITFVNPAAANLIQVDQAQLIGQPITYLLRDRSRKTPGLTHYENLITHAIKRGHKISSKGANFYTDKGDEFPVKFSCTPVEGGEHESLVSVLAFHDISEQKLAENALHQQMELFRSLFMDAPEAIVVTDSDRRIVMANPHTLELFKYRESDLIGQSPDFLYAKNDDFLTVAQAYTDRNTPELAEYQMRYRRADGAEFIAENVRSKIMDDDGNLKGYIIHARDISARLKIESEVNKAQNRLSIATESAGIGVWEMDIQRASLIWDQRMFELYGLARKDEVVDYNFWESLIHPEDLEYVRHESDRVIEAHQDLNIVFRIIREDGEIRYIKANARTATDQDGQPLYLFGTNIDVTERYETEAVLKEAREEAIRASQAKSNFLATMSHEIRTPLNGVLGMAEIMSSSSLNKQQHNYLSIIRSSGESLLELINEILDFSKIESGHFSLDEIDFDLEALVYDLSRLLVVKAESKGIELLVEFNLNENAFVHGDAYRIRQVLTNLVGNAIKFTERGQVIIRLDGSPSTKENEVIIDIQVLDSGIGISEEAIEQLFKAFVQADNSTTRKFGGTGLGLAITKQLVELMGGEIGVTSQVDVGSVFKVSLPLLLAENVEPPVSATKLDHFEKVLVVDDNATNLSILRNQLNQCSIEAEFEQCAVIALDKIVDAAKQSVPYDLLILDYLMPEMDGVKLAELLKDMISEDMRPHIMMISSAGTLSSEDLKGADIDVCLNKPASVRDLKAGFDTILTMPFAKSRIIDQSYSIATLSDENYNEIEMPSAKLLVVEDMKANLAVVKGMLAHYDLLIETAENGVEAVERWEEFSPDIILMDLHMPVMDGLEAIKLIREKEQQLSLAMKTPILALTADIHPDRMEQVYAAGGDGYITKPFKGSELIRAVASWLNVDSNVTTEKEKIEVEDVLNHVALDDTVLSGLEELLGDQVKEVVLAFVEDSEGIMKALNQAIAENSEQEQFYRPAHSLKSVSANIGAMRLSQLALTLEQQAKNEAIKDASSQVAGIARELDYVLEALRQSGRLV
ncbi:PAS domain S-box protein [Marinomonas ostreistagni]|uniref:histidine kinase n=1 Tax=Marinomonas ostreistagni TaxID=359209 RepID=A0ABS0ZEY1_9GAMM|nr:PAS domain S-box protein [Marinomonas ostreistagni]MBJ7552245.1 PAS domain S-box protein [Marinomonas ostreistagni]